MSTSCKGSNLSSSNLLIPIRVDEFITLLKEYDFNKNSVRKFANEYNVTEKTVIKYLKLNNIDYNSRTLVIDRNRDVSGKFCLALQKGRLIRSQGEANEQKQKHIAKNPKGYIDLNLRKTSKQELTYPEKVKRIEAALKF